MWHVHMSTCQDPALILYTFIFIFIFIFNSLLIEHLFLLLLRHVLILKFLLVSFSLNLFNVITKG